MNAQKKAEARTGNVFFCGPCTEQVFESRPVPKRMRSLSVGVDRAGIVLETGEVLMASFRRKEDDKKKGSGKQGQGSDEEEPSVDVSPWELSPGPASFMCLGKTHGFVVTEDGASFSWGGPNDFGELGLGGSIRLALKPQALKGSLKGRSVACLSSGAHHCLAVGTGGGLYSWGRGFEGQTGQGLDVMDKEVVEKFTGVIFAPRLIAFSNTSPVSSVACGHTFTLCTTQAGDVYAWGEGGCGQLGCGRVKSLVVPTKVYLALPVLFLSNLPVPNLRLLSLQQAKPNPTQPAPKDHDRTFSFTSMYFNVF